MRPQIDIASFAPDAALKVLQNLDVNDALEASLMVGGFDPVATLAQFHLSRGGAHEMAIAYAKRPSGQRIPFSLVAITPTGFPGVATAQMLSCNHEYFQRELAALATTMRDAMADFVADQNLSRIEARCWDNHPTAPGFLAAIGFARETPDALRGFGASGAIGVLQFAWTKAPDLTKEPSKTENAERKPECV